MKNHPDTFLTICNELEYSDFPIKLKIYGVSDATLTNEAIRKLKESPIEDKRKKEIIRVLKKTAKNKTSKSTRLAWSH